MRENFQIEMIDIPRAEQDFKDRYNKHREED